jgi:hypothetical protein
MKYQTLTLLVCAVFTRKHKKMVPKNARHNKKYRLKQDGDDLSMGDIAPGCNFYI